MFGMQPPQTQGQAGQVTPGGQTDLMSLLMSRIPQTNPNMQNGMFQPGSARMVAGGGAPPMPMQPPTQPPMPPQNGGGFWQMLMDRAKLPTMGTRDNPDANGYYGGYQEGGVNHSGNQPGMSYMF